MKRIVIFCNGTLSLPERLLSRLRGDDIIFCADGGANHALALGLMPHAVIGDLDSIDPANLALLEEEGVSIHRYPREKDFSDFELAIEHACRAHPREMLMVGVAGGRLDHMLANIMLCARSSLSHIRVSLVDGLTEAFVLQAGQGIEISGAPGDLVSLIPLAGAAGGVATKGLKWGLEGAALEFGRSLALSNVLTAPKAEVKIAAGSLLVLHIASA
jgi:thiamine pyrophosphokinase